MVGFNDKVFDKITYNNFNTDLKKKKKVGQIRSLTVKFSKKHQTTKISGRTESSLLLL